MFTLVLESVEGVKRLTEQPVVGTVKRQLNLKCIYCWLLLWHTSTHTHRRICWAASQHQSYFTLWCYFYERLAGERSREGDPALPVSTSSFPFPGREGAGVVPGTLGTLGRSQTCRGLCLLSLWRLANKLASSGLTIAASYLLIIHPQVMHAGN